MTKMTTSIRRAFSPRPETHGEDVHLHLAHDGRPYVCDYARCDSPSLTAVEANRAVRGL